MGKITKTVSARHKATLPSQISEFIEHAHNVPLHKLVAHLESFPERWPFPRGDLYHWIPVLNRFDTVLENFCQTYALNKGPQTIPFTSYLLSCGDSAAPQSPPIPEKELSLIHGPEGDRECIEAIIKFTRLLVENCGNRSLYASSANLNHLLNTTSLSLLKNTLYLALRLAQRYFASWQRVGQNASAIRHSLLQTHYQFDIDKIEQIALPFVKSLPPSSQVPGKAKAIDSEISTTARDNPLINPQYARDLLSLVKDDTTEHDRWQDFGGAWVSFYDEPEIELQSLRPTSPDISRSASSSSPHAPRRTSGLAPHSTPRSRPQNMTEESPGSPSSLPASDQSRRAGLKVLELSYETITHSPLYDILKDHVSKVNRKSQYELLSKLRVAWALPHSLETRREIVAIRLLAIANLANVLSENQLSAKIFKSDTQETRPLQLPSQLCQLIHPPSQKGSKIPKSIQTLALITLETLTKHKQKAIEVCATLNVNVNHGVLFYVVRKYISEISHTQDTLENVEWTEALFSLLTSLASSNPRTSESLVSAGLVEILCTSLILREAKADAEFSRILNFMDIFVYQTRDAFQALVNAKGLDIISDLVAYEVDKAMNLANAGKGMPKSYRTQHTDYQIPYVQQQIIRTLFKFMNHMMSVSGGVFDRLLRNLIESSQLLDALRTAISNAPIYGSHIWSSAINILSSFIHNEPTSFAAIAEAGMIKALLVAVTQDPVPNGNSSDDEPKTGSSYKSICGIPPVPEAICTIPQVFGAICLNEAGMAMLTEANALHTFFDVLTSPTHVKALATKNNDMDNNLGSAFDELARHHPRLKSTIIDELTRVIRHAVWMSHVAAEEHYLGAKLWDVDENGETIVAGGRTALAGRARGLLTKPNESMPNPSNGQDHEMSDIPNGDHHSHSSLPASTAKVTEREVIEREISAYPVLDYIEVISRFLQSFLHNNSLCTPFAEKDGIELFLDLVTSPSLPIDFHLHPYFLTAKIVLQTLVEQKPHLVVPSLINRAQSALDRLQPFTNHSAELSHSAPLVSAWGYGFESKTEQPANTYINGTTTVKALVELLTLCQVFSNSISIASSHRGTTNSVASLNLADMYVRLVKRIGQLQSKCVCELVCFQEKRKKAGPSDDIQIVDINSPPVLRTMSLAVEDPLAPIIGTEMERSSTTTALETSEDTIPQLASNPGINSQDLSLQARNSRIIWPLLSRMPHAIAALFAAIGKSILLKRLQIDTFQKYSVLQVADTIAETLVEQLVIPDSVTERTTSVVNCWLFLGLAKRAMTDPAPASIDRPSTQQLTVVLQAFKNRGGIKKIGDILKLMLQTSLQDDPSDASNGSFRARASESATGILKFFAQLSNHKNVTEAHQAIALASPRPDRDRDKPDYFLPPQFLVELRMAIMPSTLEAWNSDPIDKIGVQNMKVLMEILQNVLDGQGEQGAFKNSDNIPSQPISPQKYWKFRNPDNIKTLEERVSESLAREALFRCNDQVFMAQEYCNIFLARPGAARNPIPSGATAPPETTNVAPDTSDTHNNDSPVPQIAPQPTVDYTMEEAASIMDGLFDSLDVPVEPSLQNGSSPVFEKLPSPRTVITVEDLDEQRYAARNTLMERSLEVLSAYDNFTFELADLITAGVAKVTHKTAMREEVTETLVQSLISFQADSDPKPKKIVAHAHLLGIIMQEKLFFEAGKRFVKDAFPSLLEFVRIPKSQQAGESTSWIRHILLIFEKMLAEDAQPHQIQWTAPTPDGPKINDIAHLPESLVDLDDKRLLLTLIMDLLPRIGKDAGLALATVRVLVILTRNLELASILGLKKNMQRLFVMIKQLAGVMEERLQSAFMIVLRHLIEDRDTITQITRSDVVNMFQSPTLRTLDTTQYVKQANHLALRQPEIFVEVTNELLMLQKYDRGQAAQNLSLKKDSTPVKIDQLVDMNEIEEPVQSTENNNADDKIVNSNEAEKTKQVDTKTPLADAPDGLIHYLVSELLTYKDVEDKESPAPAQERKENEASEPFNPSAESSVSATALASSNENNRKISPESTFKPEDHPIYVYRCFILQSLTELLRAYNFTKLEFINFSRKTDASLTPTKPRSRVLEYMLNTLIPMGTIQHAEDTVSKKKASTSTWAISVIVSLCARTPEKGPAARRDQLDVEDEPDLAHVRKFVLDHLLKAFKEASLSSEPLDLKYSRLLAIADLLELMLEVKPPTTNEHHADQSVSAQKQVSKLMFEKHFVTAFTNSIADIDLNFPSASRVVKYILRPLKLLSSAATEFRFPPEVSSASAQDEDDDELSSTGSMSAEDEREETPDIFRNSTLGMFEPGREDDSSSASSDGDEDEEMYGVDYAEDFDEDDHLHGDEVISDEDEEMEGMGPIEGLSGDIGMEVEIDVEDDDSQTTSDEDDEDDSDDSDNEEDDNDDDIDVIADEMEMEVEDAAQAVRDGVFLDEVEDEGEWQDEEADGIEFSHDHRGTIELGPGPISDGESQSEHDATHRLFDNAGRLLDNFRVTDSVVVVEDDDPMEDESAEDDEEVEEEEYDEEGIAYADQDIEEEESALPDDFFLDGPLVRSSWHHHHHHHHQRRPTEHFSTLLGPYSRDRFFPSRYRSHRNGTPRTTDDGMNPLLHRARRPDIGNIPSFFRSAGSRAVFDLLHGDPHREIHMSESSISHLSALLNQIGQPNPAEFRSINPQTGAIHYVLDGNRQPQFIRDFRGMLGVDPMPTSVPKPRDDPFQAVRFAPAPTLERWQEEARLLFGAATIEKAERVINSILCLLVPPALEAEKARKQKQAEDAKKAEEEKKRIQAETEAREREEREKREAEERARAEAEAERVANQAAEEALTAENQVGDAGPENSTEENAMEGIEQTRREPVDLENAAAEQPRIMTTIRGREYDITQLGIDQTYLEALPEDMREEVIMQQLTEQRSQAAAAGEAPNALDQEFLNALPPDIRDEIIEHEARERRLAERQEARRRAAVNAGGTPAADDMTPADLIASLVDPVLRQNVLGTIDLDDDELLAALPPAMAAEARLYGATHRRLNTNPMRAELERYMRLPVAGGDPSGQPAEDKKPRRIVQVLDKPGVATILRLMFTHLHGNARSSVLGILVSVSDNRQIRNDILSGLLSILQDGSADVGAIERSFAQLTLRAKQAVGQKMSQANKRVSLGQSGGEATPSLVVGQCLSTLLVLTQSRSSLSSFFLSEHEVTGGKVKSSRKGKGKDLRANKFPLNALIGLLGRDVVIDSSTLMEQLTGLLQTITQPLRALKKKKRDESTTEAASEPINPSSGVADGNASQNLASASHIDSIVDEQPQETVELLDAEPTEDGPSTSTGMGEAMHIAPDAKQQLEPKKPRELVPPEVPEDYLRLVINVFTARDCSSVTFRDTMALMVNLSCIPGAKKIFGEELVKQARALGLTIQSDLLRLIDALKKAETEMEAQGLALAKFSPASSDQAKLLRVLYALDYLFDQESPKNKDNKEETVDSVEEIMTHLHEHSSIGPLWHELSSCLLVTHHSEDYFFNIATILLPLIESLMIVCKRVSLDDAPSKLISKESRGSTPAPDDGLTKVFFTFTDRHKKILNDLVRQNPKLMSGTFSVLVQNPTVLEFDNKRNYFSRKLHHRGPEARHYHHPSLQLNVRRENALIDSYKALHYKRGEEIKYGKFNIRFAGEEGVDAGGVTREWFQVLSRQMFDPDYALFNPVASDRTTFHPNPLSSINEHHLPYFKFIGRIIGKALYEGRVLDCHFSRALYKRILGKSVSVKDMETIDLDYTNSMEWILKNDITDIITENFCVEIDRFGETEIIDLIENGRNIPVTEENKHEYVRLVVEYRLTGSVQEQLEHFLAGFHDIVPANLISIFDEGELELLISGMPDIDVDDWRSNTDYHQYTATSPQIQWFWRAVRSFDKEERAKLLQFVTGTGKVPLNGFKELEGMNGFTRFSVHKDYGNKDRLPSSHTCFNQLDLPEYDSYESLRKQLYTAMTTGNEYFGYA